MEKKLTGLSRRYAAALGKHLKQGPHASLSSALALGRQSVALGLETLDMARIHEQALATFQLSNIKNGFTKLAAVFFTAANIPIEETHRAARQGNAHMSRIKESLNRRTKELADSHRQLKHGVARRKVMDAAAAKCGEDHKKSLEESLQLQKRLRQLTHRVMVAQEDERKSISRELQDEIAQTLLGINVRLLSLKQHARNSTNGFKEEIASTQRLVLKSAQSVRRVAREIGYQPESPDGASASL
jgi:signal transduction histidine kinase